VTVTVDLHLVSSLPTDRDRFRQAGWSESADPAPGWLFHRGGRIGGDITSGDIRGGMTVYRLCGRGGLRGGGSVPEQVPLGGPAAAVSAWLVTAQATAAGLLPSVLAV
jgi:hypothetical protein